MLRALGHTRVALAPTGLDRGLAHPKNGLEMPDKKPRSREASEMARPRRRAARREAVAGELSQPDEVRHRRGATAGRPPERRVGTDSSRPEVARYRGDRSGSEVPAGSE
jgi:hypothetical protein